MTDQHTGLYAALAAFQGEMPRVAKDKKANVAMKGGGSYSYSYADLADIAAAAMPLLSKHGLSFITTPTITDAGNLVLIGVLAHSTGQTIEGTLPLSGRTPQEIGSALTYARRYLLGAMTGIVTDDDDDGSIANEAQKREHAEREAAQRAATEARRHLHQWATENGVEPSYIGSRFESDHGYPITRATAEVVGQFTTTLAEEHAQQQTQDQDDTPQDEQTNEGDPQ